MITLKAPKIDKVTLLKRAQDYFDLAFKSGYISLEELETLDDLTADEVISKYETMSEKGDLALNA